MNIIDEIENQFNPVIIALNFKIEALISTLGKNQLETYENEINNKRKYVKNKLNEVLTDEQLASILSQLE